MKNHILIIEDNYYKFFATKQVLEAGLNIKVSVVGAQSPEEIYNKALELAPTTVYFKPTGGVAELLTTMKKRRANRRNTMITILVTYDLDTHAMDKLEQLKKDIKSVFAKAA